MNDREEWRERVRDIRAISTIWWWWWSQEANDTWEMYSYVYTNTWNVFILTSRFWWFLFRYSLLNANSCVCFNLPSRRLQTTAIKSLTYMTLTITDWTWYKHVRIKSTSEHTMRHDTWHSTNNSIVLINGACRQLSRNDHSSIAHLLPIRNVSWYYWLKRPPFYRLRFSVIIRAAFVVRRNRRRKQRSAYNRRWRWFLCAWNILKDHLGNICFEKTYCPSYVVGK